MKIFLKTSLIIIFIFIVKIKAYSIGGVTVDQTKVLFYVEKNNQKSVIHLENVGNEQMSVSVEKADFIIATDGAFQVKKAGENSNSATGYIDCSESIFSMEKGVKKSFQISLKSGKTYKYPEYICAVLVKYIPTSALTTKSMIKTYTQVAIVVRVLSDNMIEKKIVKDVDMLRIDEISAKRIMISNNKNNLLVTLKNDSLLTVEPKLSIAVTSLISKETSDVILGQSYILPERSRTYFTNIDSVKWFEIYKIVFSYEYTLNDKVFKSSKQFSFLMVSYQLLCGLSLIIAGIILQIVFFKVKERKLKKLLSENSKKQS